MNENESELCSIVYSIFQLTAERVDKLLDVLLIIYLFYYKCVFCQALGPEFVRMQDEQHIVLELPGSIVVNVSFLFISSASVQYRCKLLVFHTI